MKETTERRTEEIFREGPEGNNCAGDGRKLLRWGLQETTERGTEENYTEGD